MNPANNENRPTSGVMGFEWSNYYPVTSQVYENRVSDSLSGDAKVPVSAQQKWKTLSTNGFTHCGIDEQDRLWAWGKGPLGDGTLSSSDTPKLISEEQWLDVSVGMTRVESNSWSYGAPANVNVANPGTNRTSGDPYIYVGYVLAIKKADGSLWGWGSNAKGVLGNGKGTDVPFIFQPRLMLSSGVAKAEPYEAPTNITLLHSMGADCYSDHTARYRDRVVPEQSLIVRSATLRPRIRTHFKITKSSTANNPSIQVASSGSYRSTPTVEVYAVNDAGTEVPLAPGYSDATFKPTLRYTVTGVTLASQSSPYSGPVAVRFSRSALGSNARASCTVGQSGQITAITVEDGGLYDTMPTASIHGTAGVAEIALSVSVSVVSIDVIGEGKYYDKFSNLRLRVVAPQGDVITPATIAASALTLPEPNTALSATYESFSVVDPGEGYTLADGLSSTSINDLCVFLPAPFHQNANSYGYSINGYLVGRCTIAPSAVSRIAVGQNQFSVVRDKAMMDATTSPGSLSYILVKGNPNPPSLRYVWPTSGRVENGTVTLHSTFNAGPYVEYRWEVRDPIVSDVNRDGAYYREETIPAESYTIGSDPKESGKAFINAAPSHKWLPVANTEDGRVGSGYGVFWYPYQTISAYEGVGETFLNKYGTVCNGDVYTHEVDGKVSFRAGLFTNQNGNWALRGTYYPFKVAHNYPERKRYGMAYSEQRISVRETVSSFHSGGDTSGTPVSLSFSRAENVGTAFSSISATVSNGGSGYLTEPLVTFTDIVLSPTLCDSSRSYTAVSATAGPVAQSTAISGGNIYQWGLDSATGAITPTRRGYPVRVRVPNWPYERVTSIGFISGIHGWNSGAPTTLVQSYAISKRLVPQTLGAYALNSFSDSLDVISVPDTASASKVVIPTALTKISISQKGIAVGCHPVESVSNITSGGGLIWQYQRPLWIEAPDMSGCEIPCTAELVAPVHPVKSIQTIQNHNSITSHEHFAVVCTDANDDMWILAHRESVTGDAGDRLYGWNERPDGYTDAEEPAAVPVEAKVTSVSGRWEIDEQFNYPTNIPNATPATWNTQAYYQLTQKTSDVTTVQLPPAYLLWTPWIDQSWLHGIRLVLEPDFAGAYPFSEMPIGSKVTVKRTGGVVTKVALGDEASTGSSGEPVFLRYIGGGVAGYYIPWYERTSTTSAPTVQSFPMADITKEFTVSSSGGSDLQTGLRVDVANGRISNLRQMFGAITLPTTSAVNNTYHPFENLLISPQEMLATPPGGLAEWYLQYFSQLPSVTVTLPGGVTVPFRWRQVKVTRYHASCRKAERSRGDTKTSKHPYFSIINGGTLIERSPIGTRRESYGFSGVTAVSEAGFVQTSEGVYYLGHVPEKQLGGGGQTDGRSHIKNLDITVSDGGDDFTDIPNVVPSTTPAGIAKIEATFDGKVESVGIEKRGSGFTHAPDVVFTGGGGGSGAAGTAVIEGPVSTVSVTNEGSGYFLVPRVRFSGAGISGSAIATVNSSGRISSISVTNGGKYRTPPIVQIIPDKYVSSVAVDDGGDEYTTPPTVVICPLGGGSGAGATCVISARVVEFVIQSAGSGYSSQDAPTVTVIPADGQHGDGAQASLMFDPDTGAVTSASVVSPGDGYRSAPLVRVTGGSGSGCVLTARIAGRVSAVSVTAGGSGFIRPPAVLFQGGGGTGATATASLSEAGSGATATASLSAGVVGVTVTNKGAGYKYSPSVFFINGGNTQATEAYGDFVANRITRREYNALAYVPVAQSRTEGVVSGYSVPEGGASYTSEASGASRNGPFRWTCRNDPFGNPQIYTYGENYPAAYDYSSALLNQNAPHDDFRINDSNVLVRNLVVGRVLGVGGTNPAHVGLRFEDTFPSGKIIGGTAGTDNEYTTYFRQPLVIPENGHVFYVDAIENARMVSAGIRGPATITTPNGYPSTVTPQWEPTFSVPRWATETARMFVQENLQNKSLLIDVIDGTYEFPNPAAAADVYGSDAKASVRCFGQSKGLKDIRFSSQPTFIAEDTDGTGAVIASQVNGEGKLQSVSFSSQGTNYSEGTIIQISQCSVRVSSPQCQAVVGASGAVTHVVVSSPGTGFVNPVAVIHGGKGSGAVCRVVREHDDDLPCGVLAIEVLNGGSGYSASTPPLVFVYDAVDVNEYVKSSFNSAAKAFPMRRPHNQNTQNTFSSQFLIGQWTSATIRFCDPARAIYRISSSSTVYRYKHLYGYVGRTTRESVLDFYNRQNKDGAAGCYQLLLRGGLLEKPLFHVFSRFDRVCSIRHVSPPGKHMKNQLFGDSFPPQGSTLRPYTTPPTLVMDSAECSRPPSASVTIAQYNVNASCAVHGTYHISRTS